jgi:transposase
LKELKKLSGGIEIDEALFGGHRKVSKRGWGAEGKTLVFGIYQRNGKAVITFAASDRKQHDTLIPLIN